MPDSQVLVEKIVRLQRHIAKKQEKLDFLEDHMATMTEEVKKKNRIIVEYVMKAEAGILSTDNMDENKVSLREISISSFAFSALTSFLFASRAFGFSSYLHSTKSRSNLFPSDE